MSRSIILGADYKAFLADPYFWAKGVYHDDVLLIVDGVEHGEESDLETADIPDTAQVQIECGDVFENHDRLHSLQDHYDSWKDRQVNTRFVVCAPNELVESIMAAVIAAGGQVLAADNSTINVPAAANG
jgi:hypothetical protein